MSKNLPSPIKKNLPARKQGRSVVNRLRGATALVDRLGEQLLPYNANAMETPEQRARPMILLGLWIMIGLFGVLGLWSALVPLASGAVAQGRIVVDSNRKTIQHLEGGIVKEIAVKEGDNVKAGQLLVRLDNTMTEARNDLLRGQYLTAKTTEARLLAERDGAKEITFPPELLALEKTDKQVGEAIDAQRRLFKTRRESVEGQVNVLNQKIAQSNEEIRGLREQVNAANNQLGFLNEEITVVRGLLAKGNALKPRLLSLEGRAAELLGTRGQAQAMVSRANQTINESKINIINTRTQFLNNVMEELKTTQVEVSNLVEQMRSAQDVGRRVDVIAPQDGIVTGLQVHTIGGVVKPGDALMSLVPKDDKLIVEARINPVDIDVVHSGLKAQVRLTAFKTRYMRPIEGDVVNVSADRFDDQRTGEGYFTARIEIPQSELEDLGNLKITPGMPAETLIVTGRRTMLSYLVRPIRESFGRAFREQ